MTGSPSWRLWGCLALFGATFFGLSLFLHAYREADTDSDKRTVEIKGNVVYADGNPVKKGEVDVSVAGGSTGDFTVEVKEGKYEVKVPIKDDGKSIMIMLSFRNLGAARNLSLELGIDFDVGNWSRFPA
jgi:hypothetical protein